MLYLTTRKGDYTMNTNNTENRRSFLKKAAYATPVLLAMGSLSAQASTSGGSKIYINPETKQTVQGTAKETITIVNPNGKTTTVTVASTSKLANFNKFLHR
jgi:uncharacterized protein YciI